MQAEDFDIDVTQFTEEDREFLEAVDEHSDATGDRMATTSAVRASTDLTRSQIHYRIDKFKESGLLKVEKPDRRDGNAPKEFRLTRGGSDAVDDGVFADAADPKNTLAALADHVKTLQARLEAVEVNTETDAPYPFTQRQREYIRWEIDEWVSVNDRTDEKFWSEIFPTIAAELGYPRPSSAPALPEYRDQFEYDMLGHRSKEPTTPDPEEPTIAERVGSLEEKVDALAAEIGADD